MENHLTNPFDLALTGCEWVGAIGLEIVMGTENVRFYQMESFKFSSHRLGLVATGWALV